MSVVRKMIKPLMQRAAERAAAAPVAGNPSIGQQLANAVRSERGQNNEPDGPTQRRAPRAPIQAKRY